MVSELRGPKTHVSGSHCFCVCLENSRWYPSDVYYLCCLELIYVYMLLQCGYNYYYFFEQRSEKTPNKIKEINLASFF